MITITIKAPQYLYREDVMQYRNFGRLDFKVSALGFGAMRLPTKDGAIDETKATEMIHFAIDQGLNYIDTAYNYHRGESESFLGRALRGGYRDRVKLATKMPTWLVNDSSDFDKLLNTQLDRLQVDFVDFYLLHSLSTSWTSTCFTHWTHASGLRCASSESASGRKRQLLLDVSVTYASHSTAAMRSSSRS